MASYLAEQEEQKQWQGEIGVGLAGGAVLAAAAAAAGDERERVGLESAQTSTEQTKHGCLTKATKENRNISCSIAMVFEQVHKTSCLQKSFLESVPFVYTSNGGGMDYHMSSMDVTSSKMLPT